MNNSNFVIKYYDNNIIILWDKTVVNNDTYKKIGIIENGIVSLTSEYINDKKTIRFIMNIRIKINSFKEIEQKKLYYKININKIKIFLKENKNLDYFELYEKFSKNIPYQEFLFIVLWDYHIGISSNSTENFIYEKYNEFTIYDKEMLNKKYVNIYESINNFLIEFTLC